MNKIKRMMRTIGLGLCLLFLTVTFPAPAVAQVDFEATITAWFGTGSPDTRWNAYQENNFLLAARAKERFVTPVMNHTNEVYYMPLQASPTNRSSFNLELSVLNLAGKVDQADYYLKVDNDPSVGINYVVVDPLAVWNDNSYGDASTANSAGVEGPASLYASVYSGFQLSQNLGFAQFLAMGVHNPAAASTYDYVLYVVQKGAGPYAEPLNSIQIQVVTGPGGATVDDLIAAINTDGMTHGAYVNAVKAIAKYLFDGGVLNNKEMSALISAAAQSSVGK